MPQALLLFHLCLLGTQATLHVARYFANPHSAVTLPIELILIYPGLEKTIH